MSEKNVKIIENARLDDVQPGDHLTLDWPVVYGDIIIAERREGIAQHRGENGNWYTEDRWLLAYGDHDGITLTIRRPINKEN